MSLQPVFVVAVCVDWWVSTVHIGTYLILYRYLWRANISWTNWLWFKDVQPTFSLWFLWFCLPLFHLFAIILHLFLLYRPLNKPSTELRDDGFCSPDQFKSTKQKKMELLSDLVLVFVYFKEVWRSKNVVAWTWWSRFTLWFFPVSERDSTRAWSCLFSLSVREQIFRKKSNRSLCPWFSAASVRRKKPN